MKILGFLRADMNDFGRVFMNFIAAISAAHIYRVVFGRNKKMLWRYKTDRIDWWLGSLGVITWCLSSISCSWLK
jgi:hypothetical protein